MFATERPKIREENEGMIKRRDAAEMEGDQREGRPENREINTGHMKSRRVRGEKDKGKKGERVAAISRGRVLVGGGGGGGHVVIILA